ncbi:MAG: asparagine synthase (glutamine-hydrolyzing) [Alphaproteobacteria bacterium]|nr:asparagine synthase (glutamine-hydrolyzing) [Alphaproteobacteria bacterium]
MCGIAGLVRLDGPPPVQALGAMIAALSHRGPDDEHQVLLGEGASLRGAFAVRRLAIVDRPGGRQPLRFGQVTVALNGEIYNHAALRKELAACGLSFRTETDTEVVAALIDEVGVDRALRRLDGMFALAAWHHAQERAWLVRDRLGQKPLYWTRDAQGLRFASELKGLLVFPGQARVPDPVALEQLLLFEYIPAPRSVYQGIRKLPAGSLLELDAQGQRSRRWWTPPLPGAQPSPIARERWPSSLQLSLQVAVKQRVSTDLPVAFLLSGGIDSSAVAALARPFLPAPLRSFAVVFDEPSFDESEPARLMAEHLGAEHEALRFSHADLPEALDAIGAGLCEPLADGSLPSTWFLQRAVSRAGFKLALSGDGADEHFGGYPTYLAHRAATLARPGRRLIGRVARRLPASTDNLSTGYKARRFAEGLGLPLARRNQVWLGAFLPEEAARLLGGRSQEAVWTEVDAFGAEAGRDPVAAAMYLDQRLYLGEGVLAKADRASMLHGVELRSPFLDHRLIELAAGAPTRLHLRHGQTKALLREAVAPLLPEALRARPKKGFGTPLGPWLAGPLAGLLEELPRDLADVVELTEIQRYTREHVSGHRDHRRRLWTLLVLARWWRGPWGPGA